MSSSFEAPLRKIGAEVDVIKQFVKNPTEGKIETVDGILKVTHITSADNKLTSHLKSIASIGHYLLENRETLMSLDVETLHEYSKNLNYFKKDLKSDAAFHNVIDHLETQIEVALILSDKDELFSHLSKLASLSPLDLRLIATILKSEFTDGKTAVKCIELLLKHRQIDLDTLKMITNKLHQLTLIEEIEISKGVFDSLLKSAADQELFDLITILSGTQLVIKGEDVSHFQKLTAGLKAEKPSGKGRLSDLSDDVLFGNAHDDETLLFAAMVNPSRFLNPILYYRNPNVLNTLLKDPKFKGEIRENIYLILEDIAKNPQALPLLKILKEHDLLKTHHHAVEIALKEKNYGFIMEMEQLGISIPPRIRKLVDLNLQTKEEFLTVKEVTRQFKGTIVDQDHLIVSIVNLVNSGKIKGNVIEWVLQNSDKPLSSEFLLGLAQQLKSLEKNVNAIFTDKVLSALIKSSGIQGIIQLKEANFVDSPLTFIFDYLKNPSSTLTLDLKAFLRLNPDLKMKDSEGRTLFHHLVDLDFREMGIFAGMELPLDTKDKHGKSVKDLAIEKGSISILKNCDLEEEEKIAAAQNALSLKNPPYEEIVKFLGSEDLLAQAVKGAVQNEDVLKNLLLEIKLAGLQVRDPSVLYEPIPGKTIQLLLKAGFIENNDLFKKDKSGMPPLFYAFQNKDRSAIDFLINRRALDYILRYDLFSRLLKESDGDTKEILSLIDSYSTIKPKPFLRYLFAIDDSLPLQRYLANTSIDSVLYFEVAKEFDQHDIVKIDFAKKIIFSEDAPPYDEIVKSLGNEVNIYKLMEEILKDIPEEKINDLEQIFKNLLNQTGLHFDILKLKNEHGEFLLLHHAVLNPDYLKQLRSPLTEILPILMSLKQESVALGVAFETYQGGIIHAKDSQNRSALYYAFQTFIRLGSKAGSDEWVKLLGDLKAFERLSVEERFEIYREVLENIPDYRVGEFRALTQKYEPDLFGLTIQEDKNFFHHLFDHFNENSWRNAKTLGMDPFRDDEMQKYFIKRGLNIGGAALKYVCSKADRKVFIEELNKFNPLNLSKESLKIVLKSLEMVEETKAVLAQFGTDHKDQFIEALFEQFLETPKDRNLIGIMNLFPQDWFDQDLLEKVIQTKHVSLLPILDKFPVEIHNNRDDQGVPLSLKWAIQSERSAFISKILSYGQCSADELRLALDICSPAYCLNLIRVINDLNANSAAFIKPAIIKTIRTKVPVLINDIELLESFGLKDKENKYLGKLKKLLIDITTPNTEKATLKAINAVVDKARLMDDPFDAGVTILTRSKIDKKHYDYQLQRIEVPKADPSIDHNELLKLFDLYVPPNFVGKDDNGGAIPYAVLRSTLRDLFLNRIENEIGYTGVPSNSFERKMFYEDLKNLYRNLVVELKKKNDPDIFKAALVDIAVGAGHCGERWLKEASDHHSLLSGQLSSRSMEEFFHQKLAGMRLGTLYEIIPIIGKDYYPYNPEYVALIEPHIEAKLLHDLGRSRGIQATRKGHEDIYFNISQYTSLVYFDERYRPLSIFRFLDNVLNGPTLSHDERSLIEDWLVSNTNVSPKQQLELKRLEDSIESIIASQIQTILAEKDQPLIPEKLAPLFSNVPVTFQGKNDEDPLLDELHWKVVDAKEAIKADPEGIKKLVDGLLEDPAIRAKLIEDLSSNDHLLNELLLLLEKGNTQLEYSTDFQDWLDINRFPNSVTIKPEIFDAFTRYDSSHWTFERMSQVLKENPTVNMPIFIKWLTRQIPTEKMEITDSIPERNRKSQQKGQVAQLIGKLGEIMMHDLSLQERVLRKIEHGGGNFESLLNEVSDPNTKAEKITKVLQEAHFTVDVKTIRQWLVEPSRKKIQEAEVSADEIWVSRPKGDLERLKEILTDNVQVVRKEIIRHNFYETDESGQIKLFDDEAKFNRKALFVFLSKFNITKMY